MIVFKNLTAVCLGISMAGALTPTPAQERGSAEPGGAAGTWAIRTARKPIPSAIVVPEGYKVGVFVSGIDTPSAVTVDADDNVWVTISGNLFGSAEPEKIDQPNVSVFDKRGNLIRKIGEGLFKSVLVENYYCAENGKTYVMEYNDKVWEIDGVNGTPRVILDTLPIGDHRNGGITCHKGAIYYGQGFPTSAGFADPDAHGLDGRDRPLLGEVRRARPPGYSA